MKKIEIIERENSLIDFIAKDIYNLENLSQILVVFPNIRPGYYLKKRIFELKGKESEVCDVLSIDDFIAKKLLDREIFESVDDTDMLYLLYSNFKKEIDEFFLKDMDFDEFWGWGKIIIKDFEELKINGVLPGDIKIYDFLIKDGINLKKAGSLKEYERFSKLYGEFYEYLLKGKKYSRALSYERFSKVVYDMEFEWDKIIFAGFFAFNRTEKNIFSSFYKMNKTSFVFTEHPLLKDKISFLDSNIEIKNEIKIPNLKIRRTLNRHHEIFSLKNNLKNSSLSKDRLEFDSDTAVITPDSSMIVPLIEIILYDVKKFNISAGFPFKYSPIYSVVELLKETVDGAIVEDNRFLYLYSSYIKLVSHPYIKSIGDIKNEISEVKKRYSESFLGFIKLSEIEEKSGDIKVFNETVLKPFEEIKNIEDFLKKISAALGYIIRKSSLSSHPYWKNVFETGIGEIENMAKKKIAGLKFKEKKYYFNFLDFVLDKTRAPFIGTPIEGLQCIGFLESRGLKFKNLYFIDVNDGIIPSKEKQVSFLSDYLRKNLGIPAGAFDNDIYRYYFENLVFSASNVWIFHTDNDKNSRSPLVERIVWFCEKNKIKIDDKMEDNLEISFKPYYPQKIPKKTEIKNLIKDMTHSSSSVETYLRCELEFYYRYVLGLSKPETLEEGLCYADYGSMAHSAIEIFFNNWLGKKINAIRNDELLIENSADTAVKKYLDEKSYDFHFIKRQIKKRLKDIYGYFLKNKYEHKIISCEKKINGIWMVGGKHKIKITAKADMITEKEGRYFVVDFKTSSSAEDYIPRFKKLDLEEYKEINSVQLPFYIKIFSDIYSVSNASIIVLGLKEISEVFCYDKYDFKKYQKKAELAIQEIILEMIEKDFFEPAEKLSCQNCEFKDICYK